MKLELISELAYALALLPSGVEAVNRIYRRAPGRYYAAAMRCTERNNPALSCGRGEHYITALKAMGIVAEGNRDDMALLLRSADRNVYDSLSGKQPGERVRVALYALPKDGDSPDEVYSRLIIAMAVCAFKQLVAEDDDELLKMVMGQMENRRADAAMRHVQHRDRAAEMLVKQHLGGLNFSGIGGLFEANDTVRETLEKYLILLNGEGIDAGAYTVGAMVKPHDAGQIAGQSPEVTAVNAMLLLMARGIRADREYMKDLYRQTDTSPADAAKLEAERAKSEIVALRQRVAALENECGIVARERDALRREIKSHSGDAQELAALRESLYMAASESRMEPESRTEPESRSIESLKGAIVVGGSEVWAARLRESLKVRVWPAGTTCPAQVIGAADEVWIQAGYITHAEYYAVIGKARSAGVPVRYFSTTGADKCIAEMLKKQ